MSTSEEDYELCTRVDNVNLPKQGYFGISAATGGLAGMWLCKLWFTGLVYIVAIIKAEVYYSYQYFWINKVLLTHEQI